MKNKRLILLTLLLSLSIIIVSCSPADGPKESNDDKVKLEEELKQKEIMISELEEKIKDLEGDKTPEDEEHLLVSLISVLKSLENENMEELKEYIHPQKGLRFTAYPYIDIEKDIVLKRDEIVDSYNNSKVNTWGDYDGSGEPIELSFKDYYKSFVYDKDFINAPIIGRNNSLSSGNTIDNVKEAYPDGQYIEMYFDGFDKEFEGIDWESLKLVFEEYENKWFLVGIIHGQWTI